MPTGARPFCQALDTTDDTTPISALDAKIEILVRIHPGSRKRNSIQARR